MHTMGPQADVEANALPETTSRVAQEVRFLPRPDGGELYVALTVPADASPSRAALLCPPIFEEHGRAYPVLRELARYLAGHRIATLRFDYAGIGESSADPDVFTMRAARTDISFLASWLRDRFPAAPLVPIGVRFGARLALEALGAQVATVRAGGPFRAPIVWDPVLDAREYLLAELRSTIAGAMVVSQTALASREDIVRETLASGCCERRGYKLNQIDGYTVSRELLQDARINEPSTWTYEEPVVALVATGQGDGERQKKQLASKLPRMNFRALRDEPYWTQTRVYRQVRPSLFDATRLAIET
jgi:hypothetical protein